MVDQTERDAQQHYPNETVAWLNMGTGVYHFRGQRWYGAIKEGCYERRKQSDHEGDRRPEMAVRGISDHRDVGLA